LNFRVEKTCVQWSQAGVLSRLHTCAIESSRRLKSIAHLRNRVKPTAEVDCTPAQSSQADG
ncbi:MAG: hypothetical protein QNK37_37570, partial [Acidobacteriota bacterium]|nr:hypothetical protein [Acidobacteriota bacterium]